jgi:phage shock protein PspC (stress-responsive transcriptional regulator)
MVGGVCNGLAAYFHIDVTLVRMVCLVIAFATKGFGIMAYVAAMFIIPEAKTAEDRAAASGAPLNAKDVIDRAKKQYAEGSKHWRRQWRQQQRQLRRHRWTPGVPFGYGPPPWAAAFVPLFGIAQVAIFLTMGAMMISLVNNGAVLSWRLPEDVPVWAGVLILLLVYQIAVAPLRAVQQWSSLPQPGGTPALFAFWNAVTWMVGLAFAVWIASNHVPEIREFLQHLPELVRDFAQAVRDFVGRS